MKNETVVRLFDLYVDDVYKLALSYVGIKQEAEDITQTVFMKLIAKNIPLKQESEKAYLLKMTVNLCKDYLKSSQRKQFVSFDDLENVVSDEYETDYDEKEIYSCLMTLPEKYRVPLYLYYYEGYSYREIAKILKIGESAAAMRISRAKKELKSNWRIKNGKDDKENI